MDRTRGTRGFTMIGVLFIVALLSAILIGSVRIRRTSIRMVLANKKRAERYYTADETMAKTLSWVRANSKNLLNIFKRDLFYSTFDRGAPAVGDNDGSYSVATRLKVSGSSDSILLTNEATLGTSTYPDTENIDTSASFSPTTQFGAASLGSAKVKLTLVDAFPADPSKDYGAPPQPTPETDFTPVYRIDSMTDTDRGVQIVGYVVGELVYSGPNLADATYALRLHSESPR